MVRHTIIIGIAALLLTTGCRDTNPAPIDPNAPPSAEAGYAAYMHLIDSLRETWYAPDLSSADSSRLALSQAPDSAFANYLTQHRPLLDSLVTVYRTRPQRIPVTDADSMLQEYRDGRRLTDNRNATVYEMLRRAGASSIFSDDRYPYCIFLRLGGIDRAQAGLLYAAHGCTLPKMDKQVLVYLAPIDSAWSIYRAL